MKGNKMGVYLYRIIVGIIGFSFGIFFSYLFYSFVLIKTDLHPTYIYLMLGSVSLFLSIGFAFSTQIRCITCLTFPVFGTRTGMRTIQASLIIIVLTGPIENIQKNGSEVTRMLSCLKNLTMNITMTGKDLVIAPFQHIIYELKTGSSKTKQNIDSLSKILKPVEEEVEETGEEIEKIKAENDMIDKQLGKGYRSTELEKTYKILPGDTKGAIIEKKYRKKMAYKCEEIFTKGIEKCYDAFSSVYDQCYEDVTKWVAWLLCWPLKLDFICDVLGEYSEEKMCSMKDIIPNGFGTNYLAAKESLKEFREKFKPIKIDYQSLIEWVNLDDLKAVKDEAIESFYKTRKTTAYILNMLERILSFTFLYIIIGTLEYHNKYFDRLSFDNQYATKYFEKVDVRRKEAGKSHLLPLKSFERNDFHEVFLIGMSSEERKTFFIQLFYAIAQSIIIFTLFAFDYTFARLLELVKDHTDIKLHQEGSHIIKLNVLGKGMLADILRTIIKDINIQKRVKVDHLTKPCLPEATTTDPEMVRKACFLLAALFVIAYIETICHRVKHTIANFFYTRRSKKRILWLYNHTMKKRKGQMAHLKVRVIENAQKIQSQVSLNPILSFSERFPKFCRCLRFFKSGRRKCILCLRFGEIFRCPKCNFSFCKECYEDIDKRCLYCRAIKEKEFEEEEEDPMV